MTSIHGSDDEHCVGGGVSEAWPEVDINIAAIVMTATTPTAIATGKAVRRPNDACM
jgi:hypothetical protein